MRSKDGAPECAEPRLPSFSPLDLMRWPSTNLSPGSCMRSSKVKPPPCLWLLQRPSGEDAGNLGDIFLRVAAIHAERVQLHQLAAVVFVQAAALAFGLLRWRGRRWREACASLIIRSLGNAIGEIGVRSHAQPVIQIEEHGRALRGRDQQVFKLAQSACGRMTSRS